MDWIKDFVSGSEYNNFELEKIEHDHFQQKGLILDFNKVNNIIIINIQLSGKNEVGFLLAKLYKYIILMNNFKTEIDWDAVENVIESDFLVTNL